jgi:hypothetical protein
MSLAEADRAEPLEPDDLELLATSASMTGRMDEYLTVLERIHHAHLDAGEGLRAVRAAYCSASPAGVPVRRRVRRAPGHWQGRRLRCEAHGSARGDGRPTCTVAGIDPEAHTALARVATFDGASSQRIDDMTREMEGPERPEDIPATEVIDLDDPEDERSLAIVFFVNEEDYAQGDAALSAMPAGDTPGARSSVSKYNLAIRLTD